jgi:hypothetical protein
MSLKPLGIACLTVLLAMGVTSCSKTTPTPTVDTSVSDGQAQAALLRAFQSAQTHFDKEGTFRGLASADALGTAAEGRPSVKVGFIDRFQVVLVAQSSSRRFCLGEGVEHGKTLPGIAFGIDAPDRFAGIEDCADDNRSDTPPPWLPSHFVYGRDGDLSRYWSGWEIWQPMPRCEVPRQTLVSLGRVQPDPQPLASGGAGQEVYRADGSFRPDIDPLWLKLTDDCYVAYHYEPRG